MPITTRISFLLLPPLLMLVACGDALRVPPDREATVYVFVEDERGPDDLMLDRRGRAPSIHPTDDRPVLAGIAQSFFPGADPFPRDRLFMYRFVGLVRFDLTDPWVQASLREKELDRAVLVLHKRAHPQASTHPNTRLPYMESYSVGPVVVEWSAGFDRIEEPSPLFPEPGSGPNFLPRANDRGEHRIGVTGTVRSWIDGSRPNFGFYIRPRIPLPYNDEWADRRFVHAYFAELELTFREP